VDAKVSRVPKEDCTRQEESRRVQERQQREWQSIRKERTASTSLEFLYTIGSGDV